VANYLSSNLNFPEIVDIAPPDEGVFHNLYA
jgi:hypothetical protein